MGRTHATALRRELGAELKKQRKAARLTEAELAKKVGWGAPKISRMESGHIPANDLDVVQYLGYCGCWLGEVQDIIDLTREAEHHESYWLRAFGKGQEDSIRSLIFHESMAIASTTYEPHVVPGLLQTQSYAQAIISRYTAKKHVEFCLNARMERQQILHRPNPTAFMFLLHEHALHHRVGEPATMYEQMLALMLLDGLPGITIRVVPESSMFGGAFRLFQFAKHKPLVYLDTYAGAMFLDDDEYVESYTKLLPAIADVALNEGQSREYLATLASEYDRGSDVAHVEEEHL